jgi:alkylation response protein AidB-like acyl-CoA dehydrogenase
MRRALKNEIPFFSVAGKLKDELPAMGPLSPNSDDGSLGYQQKLLDRAKKIFLFLCDAAAQKYGMALEEQQEILGLLADTAMETYAMESGLLRALKSIQTFGEQQSKTKIDMVQLYVNDAMVRISDHAWQILAAMETGDTLDNQLSTLRKLSQFTPVNGVQLRREIADRVIEAERYTC